MSRSGTAQSAYKAIAMCLNPSFSGCPALGIRNSFDGTVGFGLNPSFSGCPALGFEKFGS